MDISSTIHPAPSILASRVSELPSRSEAIKSQAMSAPTSDTKGAEKGFASAFSDAIGELNSVQVEATESIRSVAAGESQDLHGTMIAIEKAGIALKFTTQLRNKMVEAYQEIMRMQV